jgi:hypothetical protein
MWICVGAGIGLSILTAITLTLIIDVLVLMGEYPRPGISLPFFALVFQKERPYVQKIFLHVLRRFACRAFAFDGRCLSQKPEQAPPAL